VGADGTDACNVLASSLPDNNGDQLGGSSHLHIDMLESLRKRSSWSSDLHGSRLELEGNSLWDNDGILGLQSGHVELIKERKREREKEEENFLLDTISQPSSHTLDILLQKEEHRVPSR
jgi:hypothetical protein